MKTFLAPRKLEKDMYGPVDPRGNPRVSNRVVGAATPTPDSNPSPFPRQRDGISRPGDPTRDKQRSNLTGGEPSRWLPIHLFLVPKKGGGHRPIINLKKLNEFVPHHHFEMEGIHMLKDLLKQGDFMAKIDLKDAYFARPISDPDKKYLRFRWKDQTYQFNCLPFGLSCAPWVFTKITKAVTAVLREMGIKFVIYIDDILVMAESEIIATTYIIIIEQNFILFCIFTHTYEASEFRSWLLYYSLPVLCGILPDPYFTHYSLVVAAIHLLLSETITDTMLHKAEQYLNRFYEMFAALYGKCS